MGIGLGDGVDAGKLGRDLPLGLLRQRPDPVTYL
jgi:hypothetical protein